MVLAWKQPAPEEELVKLDESSNDELLIVAESIVPPDHAKRLHNLLVSRALTESY